MQLVSFEVNQTKDVLGLLDIRTRMTQDDEFILNELNQVAKCEVCNNSLTTKNLGNVAKGSNLLFCDDPDCFATHIARKNY